MFTCNKNYNKLMKTYNRHICRIFVNSIADIPMYHYYIDGVATNSVLTMKYSFSISHK